MNEIKTVSFNYKNQHRKKFGVIAQDLDELLKKYNYIGDMVHEDNNNFGVDYIDFIIQQI